MGKNSAYVAALQPVRHPALAGHADHLLILISAKCQETDSRTWTPSVADMRWLREKVGLSKGRLYDLLRLLRSTGHIRVYERTGRQRNRPNVYQVVTLAPALSGEVLANLHALKLSGRKTFDRVPRPERALDGWSDLDDARHSDTISEAQQLHRAKRAKRASGTTWTPRIVDDFEDEGEAL